MTSGDEGEWLQSWIGSSDRDHITVGGLDLPTEIMGRLTLTELAYLLITKRQPTEGQRRMLDVVFVSLADHGLTPGALATRLTYTGAPEATQAAVAAGLLGAGSVFLGPAGDTAQFLASALADGGADAHSDDATLRAIAEVWSPLDVSRGDGCPGSDIRFTKMSIRVLPRLYELAEELGVLGANLRLLALVAQVHEEVTGRHLPVNGAGAGGAALVDIGIPHTSVRGVVLIARTAGLVAHLTEETENPIGLPLWLEVEARARPKGD